MWFWMVFPEMLDVLLCQIGFLALRSPARIAFLFNKLSSAQESSGWSVID